MRKELSKKELTAKILLTLLLGCCVALPGVAAAAGDAIGAEAYGDDPATGGKVKVEAENTYDYVYGGKAKKGDAYDNTVSMTGGKVNERISGGYSDVGNANRNVVTISGGLVGDYVFGGFSGIAEGNEVNISGGTIDSRVYGGCCFGEGSGYSAPGTIKGNKVTISGGNVGDDVYGGYIDGLSGTIEGNEVIISGGNVGYDVCGGDGGYGTVKGNKVTISDGTVGNSVVGGSGYETVEENVVTISGGAIDSNVYGGYGTTDTCNVEENVVTISGGTIDGSVYGGYGTTVTGNEVNISGGTIDGSVYGGYEDYYYVAWIDVEGNANENKVTISGGNIGADVYGGRSREGKAINNTVTISGNPNLEKATLYGGFVERADEQGTVSGNTLNINTKGLKVKQLANFDNLNFTLPADITSGETMLSVIGGEATNISGAKVMGYVPGDTALNTGDSVILLNNNAGITSDDATYGSGTLKEGVSLEHEIEVKKLDENNIVLTLKNKASGTNPGTDPGTSPGTDPGGTDAPGGGAHDGLLPNTKSLVETKVAAAAFLNQGADLLAGAGIIQAEIAAKAGDGEWEGFAAAGGNKLKVKTGSHVDIDGYNLNVGIAKIIANNSGKLLIGPVFEYGNGSYDSYLNNGLHGEGKTRYTGGGIIVRQDNNSGVYYEGSVRAGRVKADYKSSALGTAYDSSSSYVGAHLGIGMVQELNASSELEYYGKFFYSHTGSDDVKLTSGETYRFDSVNSERLRLGARYSHKLSELSKLYTGLAWEHEFDGDARAHYKGYGTASPSLKGSSGLLELGWQVQPGGGMNVDLNLSGWMGQQKGLTFRAAANWTF